MGLRSASLTLGLGAVACSGPAVDDQPADVIGGAVTHDFPAVGQLAGTGCTGTLIHPQAVLTSAHCVSDSVTGFRFQGADGHGDLSIAFERLTAHPSYTDAQPGRVWDVAVGILEHPVVDVTPRPLMRQPAVAPGDLVRLVGYGWTDYEGTSPTFKQTGLADIDRVGFWWVTLEREPGEAQTCPGDSGSPYLDPTTGAVVAIHARGTCHTGGTTSRGAPAWSHAAWIDARVEEGRRADRDAALHPTVFDPELYALMHPELDPAPVALESDWLARGLPAGERGAATFDPAHYVERHGLSMSYEEAARHWIDVGLPQGWVGAEEVDPAFLIDRIDDWPFGDQAFLTALEHYFARGLEHRASASYDPVFYMTTYDDWHALGLTYRAAMAHYLTVGKAEGRPGASPGG